jgi:hypothetical protein
MKPVACGLAAVAIAIGFANVAQAGPATDAFGKCLVQSSTGKDRTVFVQWFFAALSANPNVKDFATSTKEQREAVTRQTVAVFQRLVLVDCRAEAIAAIRQDGTQALSSSFEVFGRAAAVELMSDPAVQKEMNGLSDYADNQKLGELMEEAKKK